MPSASEGVWLDGEGRVVETPPVSGTQLIAPGVEPTPEDLERVERFRAAQPAAPIETATVKPGPAPAKRAPSRKGKTGK